jgi:hypothetical protein
MFAKEIPNSVPSCPCFWGCRQKEAFLDFFKKTMGKNVKKLMGPDERIKKEVAEKTTSFLSKQII